MVQAVARLAGQVPARPGRWTYEQAYEALWTGVDIDSGRTRACVRSTRAEWMTELKQVPAIFYNFNTCSVCVYTVDMWQVMLV
jgi:hypothetical protein